VPCKCWEHFINACEYKKSPEKVKEFRFWRNLQMVWFGVHVFKKSGSGN
jgi:hypothetical protein